MLYVGHLTHGHDLGTISLFGCYVKVTGGQKLLGKKSYSAILQNRIISSDPPAFNQRMCTCFVLAGKILLDRHIATLKACTHQKVNE